MANYVSDIGLQQLRLGATDADGDKWAKGVPNKTESSHAYGLEIRVSALRH